MDEWLEYNDWDGSWCCDWRLQIVQGKFKVCWWCGWAGPPMRVRPRGKLLNDYLRHWCIWCYDWYWADGGAYYPAAIDRRTLQIHKTWPKLGIDVCHLIASFVVSKFVP